MHYSDRHILFYLYRKLIIHVKFLVHIILKKSKGNGIYYNEPFTIMNPEIY